MFILTLERLEIMSNEVREHHIDTEKGCIKKSRHHRRRRHKSGEKALKEIKYFQETPRTLIPVALVRRGIRHALNKLKEGGARVTQVAFDRIHAALEDHIVGIFRSAQIMAIHAKRKTLMVEDMTALRKVSDSLNGVEDLSDEPVNPKMSKAHHHKKKHNKKEKAPEEEKKRRKHKSKSKKKEKILIPQEVFEPEEERVLEIETEVIPVIEKEMEDEDDWYAGEEY